VGGCLRCFGILENFIKILISSLIFTESFMKISRVAENINPKEILGKNFKKNLGRFSLMFSFGFAAFSASIQIEHSAAYPAFLWQYYACGFVVSIPSSL
jgi:hypothetical protein